MATPRDAALERVNDAREIVKRTRQTLTQLLTIINSGNPSVLPGLAPRFPREVLVKFDKVWRHFGQPTFPVKDPNELFQEIKNLNALFTNMDSIYSSIDGALNKASAIFRDPPKSWFSSNVPAFTVTDDRGPGDPPIGPEWPNGIYIKPEYVPLSVNLKSEVIVHECGHWVGNQDKQKIQDNYQPGDPEYATRPMGNQLDNAYSWSQFSLDCAFNRQLPFDN